MTDRIQPALRHPNPGLVPARLLQAMAGLALTAVAITAFAALTGREPVGQPHAAQVVTERGLILEGKGAKAVGVRAADGTLLADLDHGGFVTVVQNGLARERMKHGLAADLPVRLVRYDNGRLSLHDDLTGWSVELHAFGADNKAAFERLLAD